MGLSTTHLLIFLLIVVVIFGTKKLRNMGSDLGSAVKNFKDGMRGDSDATQAPTPATTLGKSATPTELTQTPIDVEIKQP